MHHWPVPAESDSTVIGLCHGVTAVAKAWLVAWVGNADATHSSDSPDQHRTPLSHDTVPSQQPSLPVEMATDDAS